MFLLNKKLLSGLLILVLSLVAFFSFKSKEPKESQESDADNVLKDIPHLDQDPQYYKRVAREIAHHLGTAYGWWNPRGWTENDQEVFNLVSVLTPEDYEIVSVLYFETYAEGNNLGADLVRLLPADLYNQLTNV